MFELLQNIKDYASLVFALLMFAYAVISFIIGLAKSHNRKLKAEEQNDELKDDLKESSDAFKLINEIIPIAIKKAEEMPNIDGSTKKLLAMSEILLQCNEAQIDFDMFKDFISEQIEALIEFSKTINKRKE